jgi:HKD family nuclease
VTDQTKRENIDSLRSIYEDVLVNRDKDPVEHILILTYEFDDQQLLNLISGRSLEDDFELRQNDLKFISDLRPVIFYDARKTKDSNQLPHFLELFPIRTKAFRCHHSKAYLIMTQRTIRLVLGSLNLTRTGLFANREVFHDFCWDKEKTSDLQVLADFCNVIKDGYNSVLSSSVLDILGEIYTRIEAWEEDGNNQGYTLLTSGYPHALSGIEQLNKLWAETSDSPPTRILTVSPFFDKAGGGDLFSDSLCKSLDANPELVLVTDKSNTGLSKMHYGSRAAKRALFLISPEISESERKRIQEFNNNVPIKDLAIERKLHAKILVLSVNDTSLVYMGSANFTNKAWNGDNHELGLAWVEKGDPEKIEQQILACLQASRVDSYGILPEQPIPDLEEEDDEGYTEESSYPDFLQSIVLKQTASKESVQFEFLGENLENLSRYNIHWGRLPLRVDGGLSHELGTNEFYSRLIGGKNLAFEPKSSLDKTVYIPFIHSPELFQQRDLFIFPSSEDWLQYYLGYNREPVMSLGEFLPGEEDGATSAELDIYSGVDRDSNVVISMQRYLNLFSGVEKEFTARSVLINEELGEEREDLLQKTLLAPLNTYAKILERERGSGVRELVYCFKIGELILFCNRLTEYVPEMKEFILGLATSLNVANGNTDSALHEYLRFCTGGGQLDHR